MTRNFTVKTNTTPRPHGSFDPRYIVSEVRWYVVYMNADGDAVADLFVCRPDQRLKDVLAAQAIEIEKSLIELLR